MLARLEELDAKIQHHSGRVKAIEERLEELKTSEAADQEALAEAEKLTEKQLNKRSMLVQKREENLKRIQQLGSLPAAELDAHATFSVKELMKKLHKVYSTCWQRGRWEGGRGKMDHDATASGTSRWHGWAVARVVCGWWPDD